MKLHFKTLILIIFVSSSMFCHSQNIGKKDIIMDYHVVNYPYSFLLASIANLRYAMYISRLLLA